MAVFEDDHQTEQQDGTLGDRGQNAQVHQIDSPQSPDQAGPCQVNHRAEDHGDIGVFGQAHGSQGGISQHIVGEAEHGHGDQQPQGKHHFGAFRSQPEHQQGFGKDKHNGAAHQNDGVNQQHGFLDEAKVPVFHHVGIETVGNGGHAASGSTDNFVRVGVQAGGGGSRHGV